MRNFLCFPDTHRNALQFSKHVGVPLIVNGTPMHLQTCILIHTKPHDATTHCGSMQCGFGKETGIFGFRNFSFIIYIISPEFYYYCYYVTAKIQ